MAVDATSTTEEVEAEYDNSASYFATADIGLARRFITATTILLRRLASGMLKGSNSLSFRRDLLREELKDARDFLKRRDPALSGPRVTRGSFRRFRDC